MTDKVDAITSLVTGVVSTPVVSVQPTVSSVFGKLVEPRGVDPRYSSDHSVGGPSIPGFYSVMFPNPIGGIVYIQPFLGPQKSVKSRFFRLV